jgi:glycerol-3-phosphate dehydrogenase
MVTAQAPIQPIMGEESSAVVSGPPSTAEYAAEAITATTLSSQDPTAARENGKAG